jgi:hypothetical protein
MKNFLIKIKQIIKGLNTKYAEYNKLQKISINEWVNAKKAIEYYRIIK